MALVLGTNCGFVTVAPSADPGGSAFSSMNTAFVTRDTSPATAAKITEIGWWCNNATDEANFEVGLYAADGAVVPNEAGTRLFVDTTNAKGTDAGWKRVSVNWVIDSSTDYWIGVHIATTSTLTQADRATSGFAGYDLRDEQANLPNPFGGGNLSDSNGMFAFYAVWEVAPTNINPKVKVSGTFATKKTLVKIGGTFAEKPVLVKVSGTFQ